MKSKYYDIATKAMNHLIEISQENFFTGCCHAILYVRDKHSRFSEGDEIREDLYCFFNQSQDEDPDYWWPRDKEHLNERLVALAMFAVIPLEDLE